MSHDHKEYMRQYLSARRAEHRERLHVIKLESGCVDCGYKESATALDFDHTDPSSKKFKVSELCRSWESILAEIAKCEVRCANCHRIKTAKDWS